MAVSLALLAVWGVLASGARATRARETRSRVAQLQHERLATPQAGTFVSLWPACACGKRTVLDQFSMKTGRRLGTIANVRVPVGGYVSAPSAILHGPVLLTFSSGPDCASPGLAQCEPVPDSCISRIESIDPNSGVARALLSFPSSLSARNAVLSPSGQMVVMDASGCATSFFDDSLMVRNLATGREWSIGADAPPCHGIGPVSWSPNGAQLVFAYAPSILPYGTAPSASSFCSTPKAGRLAVVSALHSSSSRSWKLIAPDKRCSFEAAAFDRKGFAAAEGCSYGQSQNDNEAGLGNVYLLQFDRHDRVIARVALQPGWEQGLLTTDDRTGMVLVSQDQPANAGYPERDWVWEFDGSQLHSIANYAAEDAAQVIAVPW
jgi:hypothetical protein